MHLQEVLEIKQHKGNENAVIPIPNVRIVSEYDEETKTVEQFQRPANYIIYQGLFFFFFFFFFARN